MELTCKEIYGSSKVNRKYFSTGQGRLAVYDDSPKFTSISHFFRCVFLPQGYPESVSDDYLTYQMWDTVQAFCSSITGTLAAQAVLKGVGVGDTDATVLAATFTWILKDGTGMLGRILFAWIQGTNLDCDAKRWRLFADILNDVAIFMEILAPNFKVIFTPIVCTAGVCKSIVGVAGGATRAALTQHQARRNNMADVSAKDGSQETLVNLLGLLCNLLIVPIVTGNDLLIWILYALFTMLHLYANYCAVTCVVMETINKARLNIIVNDYLSTHDIPSVQSANYREPVVSKTKRKFRIKLGVPFSEISERTSEVADMLKIYQGCSYILRVNINKKCISIILSDESDIHDYLQSCFQAEVINYVASSSFNSSLGTELRGLSAAFQQGSESQMSRESLVYTKRVMKSFCHELQDKGWHLDPVLLGPDEWRAIWDPQRLNKKKDL